MNLIEEGKATAKPVPFIIITNELISLKLFDKLKAEFQSFELIVYQEYHSTIGRGGGIYYWKFESKI
eukprot:snap_masked-scaffold_5-processed-gene-18.22-mRNA-1 protein AED:1.00 eAED:1.00 QI:0/-1/0/0/-1/1/1/0/66